MANDISTSFNDRQMFITQPDWGKDITSKIAIERRILQYIGGVKIISEINTDTPITASGDFTLSDRESIYNLLEFFNARKGGTKSFWFLHPARFFTLKENYSSGNSYIEVERNYGDLWTQALPTQYDWGIYIYMHNGDLICRKVTGITDETDRSYIYLDDSIPRNITADNHFIIGRTLVGRFDQNQLSIDFSMQGLGITPLKLKENYRVYDSWTPIEGVRQWDVAFTTSSQSGTARATSLTAPFIGNVINSLFGYPMGGSYGQIYYYNSYFRIYGIDIPQGSTIKSATLTIVCSAEEPLSLTGFNMNCSCADYDNAPSFTTVAIFKGLARTVTVNWTVANGVEWIVGDRYTTPDLAACFQQIVNRPGWVSGNSVLICMDQVSDMGWVYKYWARFGYSGSDPTAPGNIRLKIEWV